MPEPTTTIAVDTETFLIGPGEVLPQIVCLSMAYRTKAPTDFIDQILVSDGDGDELHDTCETLLSDDDARLVFHNAGYDLGVIARSFPDLIPLIWKKLAAGNLVTDTGLRERLLNNGTTGRLTQQELPDGSFQRIDYSLAGLCFGYLGLDLSLLKDTSNEDVWRMNYHSLAGVPSAEYPEEAAAYAKGDALHTLQVYEAQRQRVGDRERGPGSVHGEYLKTAQDVALRFITARGMCTDPVERARLEAWVAEELADDKMNLLVESGILRPAQYPRPNKNTKKRVAELFGITVEAAEQDIDNAVWSEDDLTKCRDNDIRTTAGKKASLNTKVLRKHITDLCSTHDIPLRMTDPSTSYPDGQVSTDDKMIALLTPSCQIMGQYEHRAGMLQIANTELPRMQAPIVHFNYSAIVSSYRTSSSGGDRNKQLYPATNGQNVNPKVRRAYVPRPGNIFCSADYDRLELCTLGQKCFELFEYSVMRDMINQGVDVHAYLGAQICLYMDTGFAAAVKEVATEPLQVYEAFMSLKTSDDEIHRALFAQYRKLAKPTGLGYPGGLGPKTFITFAGGKGYNVEVDLATATMLREIWFNTFPEMREYFAWVNQKCEDPDNAGSVDDEGRPRKKYCYYSPLGHYRAGCAFTEAANGAGLQTFAADGFAIAVFNVVRACSDPTFGSILYGSHVVNQIHDEIICEWEDDERSPARAEELCEIMVESMRQVVPDTKISVAPALMRRWDKFAEPVYEGGVLQVWEPNDATA